MSKTSETKSFWDRDLAEILGGKETLADESVTVDKGSSKYMKYERIMIDLNNGLPADLYFRTRYTDYGYDLYLFSFAAKIALEMHIDLQSGLVFDDDRHVLCKYDGLVDYLKSIDFTTDDTSDDIEHDTFIIDGETEAAVFSEEDENE